MLSGSPSGSESLNNTGTVTDAPLATSTLSSRADGRPVQRFQYVQGHERARRQSTAVDDGERGHHAADEARIGGDRHDAAAEHRRAVARECS